MAVHRWVLGAVQIPHYKNSAIIFQGAIHHS